ncbi:transposase [Cucumis melo var. makuwa]|uniref:Transposase n=1 Tax=Cucumis melo var. makuwa TaxID=1194695 RepID=A0A5D3BPP4_CUCMM|nr:transposase [Cucumis melo var. makuwa]
MAYIGHRKFLPRHHPYRKQKKVFNGAQELELAPEPLSGEEIFIQTNVMHIEKNVCANLIGTLLDIPGKTKDGVKSRLDLVELNIRSELAPQVGEKKIFLPPACYTLSRAEKLSFCKTLSELKVPEGYSSNIQSLVSLTDLKLYGLKSHDHHVLMQQLLPVAIRGILPKHVEFALEVPKNSITPSLRWIAHGPSLDCDWVDNRSGVKVDELGFTIVDLKRIGHKSDSFILATQAKQIFYVQDSANLEWMPNVDTPNETDDTNSTYIRHDCEGRWVEKEARKGRNNDYFDDAIRDCASRIDELVATYKNEDILTDTLGSKEHGGRVRGVGGFVSQSQYFNTVKGKKKMKTPQVEICHKEEDDLRCKSDKKRSNHSRSSIGSIHIDLDADEDLVNTPSNKGVEEHSTRKDVVYSSNYTDVNGTIKLLNRHVVNNMKDVDMIHIPMNELIFGSDKFVYLAREDLLHYCCMVEIGYMCILAYITFHWMLHVIYLRENCVYVLDSLRSKVNEDIHGVINVVEDMASETRSTTPSINSKMETCKGCGYYVQKYIHEIVHNSSTSITSLFNTKNAYRQEEIDEIRTK